MEQKNPAGSASTEHMVDYDRNSAMQHHAVRSKSEQLLALVDAIGAVDPEFAMMDLGCGPGHSALASVRPVIDAYRRHSADGTLVIRHADQAGNDWSALMALVFGPDGYRGADPSIRTEAAIGSFYTELAAPGSIDLVTCFAASHWLSRPTPLYSPGTVWFADLEGEARRKMAELARADWTRFLRCRAHELRSGGYLLAATLASVPDASERNGVRASASGIYRAIHDVAHGMVGDGLLQESALDHFLFPLWFPTAADYRLPVEEEPDLARAFEIIEADVAPAAFNPDDVYADEIDDPALYAQHYAGYVRGFGESSLRLHLFAKSADDAAAVDELTEEFFRRLEQLYRDEPGRHASETMLITLILRRR